MWYYFFFFFFSSRRRHTRFLRDWSSDVCSSDLLSLPIHRNASEGALARPALLHSDVSPHVGGGDRGPASGPAISCPVPSSRAARVSRVSRVARASRPSRSSPPPPRPRRSFPS